MARTNLIKEPGKPVDLTAPQQRTLWQDAWRRLSRSNTAWLGLFIIGLFVLSAIFAHLLWEYDPAVDLDYTLKLKAPNLVATEEIPSVHIFGTDKLGRDIFRRVVHGGWNSLLVGIVAVGISLIVGGLLGLFSGFYENTTITPLERIFFMGAVGMALGSLPAWVARQPLQVFLFGGLGLVSALYSNFCVGKKVRNLIFAAIGLLMGALPSLLIAPLVAVVCGIVGMTIGWLLGSQLEGQLFSNIVMRFMDIILTFPGYLLAIAIVAFLGPGLEKGMIAIGVVGIPVYARLVRSAVLSVSPKEYNIAAQALGASHGRIIFKHIFPNILSPIIVQTTMGLASAILSAAALGFLGLGAIPPEPEWGAMLGDSYRYLTSGAWWAVLFPGLAIMFSVLGFNLLGDGLRDALDPKLRT